MKVLFLDIDGVLNGHERHPNGYCGIDPWRMGKLNWIVEMTGCRIVLASAWRYMILGGDMTLKGFGHMLATYGADQRTVAALYDHLPADRVINDPNERGKLAAMWLDANSGGPLSPGETIAAVAIDDGDSEGCDLGYEVMGIPSVRPKSSVGMTDLEAAMAVRILNGA